VGPILTSPPLRLSGDAFAVRFEADYGRHDGVDAEIGSLAGENRRAW
jgi:hypothetical protein